jgi:undecaprenyl-phosphate galactose phosphotransferase
MQEPNGVSTVTSSSDFIRLAHGLGGDRHGQRGSIGVAAEPLPSLLEFPSDNSYWVVGPSLKRAFDLLAAVALVLIFSPLLVLVPLLMWKQGGPVVFRQQRVGRYGRSFSCLKFRTMVPDADRLLWRLLSENSELRAEWLATQKLQNDPRVTPVGRFLRRTSLDELPQLWNILRGDMSLVGPRPVVPDELSRYGRSAVAYLAAKPGLTGLWQVSGRDATTYRRRVALDVCYVRYAGPLLDFKILCRTAGVILGARAR